jgi:AbrB family transcriptional regulator, transcriptional pleiotropic regulator of transition state genes
VSQSKVIRSDTLVEKKRNNGKAPTNQPRFPELITQGMCLKFFIQAPSLFCKVRYSRAKKGKGWKDAMKATGIVRKVDQLGRIVLPMELRTTMDIQVADALEIFVEGKTILLRKYEPGCILCGESRALVKLHEKQVWRMCLDSLKASK